MLPQAKRRVDGRPCGVGDIYLPEQLLELESVGATVTR